MKRNILFVFTLMIGVLFFITGCGESGLSDTDQINAVLTKAATSVQSKDLAKFLECVSEPFVIGGVSRTHVYITDTMWPSMPDYTVYQFNSRSITVTGNTATVECYTHQEESGHPPAELETLMELSKSSGQWVITSLDQKT